MHDELRRFTIEFKNLNLPKLVSKGIENFMNIYSVVGEKLSNKMKTDTRLY